MLSSPNPTADGARRSAAAVIVRPEPTDDSQTLRRLGPAGLMSAVFHLLLLGLFVLLAPVGHGATSVDLEKPSVIEVDPEDSKPSLPLSTFPHESWEEPGESPSLPTPMEGNLTVFSGDKDAIGEVGSLIGKSGAPLLPNLPSFGLTDGKIGAKASQLGGEGPAMLTGDGGGDLRGDRSSGIRIGAASLTTKQAFDRGVTTGSLAAVNKGLKWLAYVQSSNGAWKLDGNFPDKGNANDVAGTALGLLPFLGAGKTHVNAAANNQYAKQIEKALQFLIESQDKRTGALSKDMYAHGLATIAMSEAFALSKDYRLRKPAQLAINYIVAAQHPGGGWRYSPGQAGDTSVSGWQIMALKSGLMAGLVVPSASIRRAQAFLDEVAETKTEGSGYTGPQPTPTMTAVSALCRQYVSGWGRQNLRLVKAVDNYVKPNPPRPEKKDVYYYYYATQVMHNFGGEDWKAWNVKMRDQLVASQDGDESKRSTFGSWSPAGDQWGQAGGRLMVTSLNLLTLEVYYRYLPLYYREER